MTVANAGAYEICYGVNIIYGHGSELAIAVNGVVDLSTRVHVLVDQGNVSGRAILSLAAGDAISLQNYSVIPLTLAHWSAAAQLTIKKLD